MKVQGTIPTADMETKGVNTPKCKRQASNFKGAAWRLGWRLESITIDLYWQLPLLLTLDARNGHPLKSGGSTKEVNCIGV